MTTPVILLGLEALLVFGLVLGVHALRRRTSLVYSYALMAFFRVGSWAATHGSMVTVGSLQLNVGSNVFFSAALLGVFLLYVADGRSAGRMGLMVVVVTGLLYALTSTLMHAQFPDRTATIFPDSGLRANLGSIAASLVDLVMLGVVWEAGQRVPKLPLLLRVFSTLAAVFIVDSLIYIPVAWAGGANFAAELWGNLMGRLLVAAACAPFVTLYLRYEMRRHGLVLARHAVLSILLREDAERELLSAHHQLRLGTEALWESEERYRRMVDDVPIMVFRFSVDGLVTYANRPLCAFYGRDLKDILGLHVATPIDKSEREDLWRRVMALTPSAPTVEFIAHVTPSQGPLAGQRRVQRWVVRGLFSPRGAGLAFQAVGEDVTERMAAERDLIRLSTAIAQASECVAMTDAQGIVEFVNPALEHKTGYAKEDLLGKPAKALLGDVQVGGARSELVRAVGRAEGWTGRVPLTAKAKGRPAREFWTTVTPLRDQAADVNGYVVIAHDISRETELEAKLLQAQRMEAIGRLAGGVAHDFNNLIFVIWSCAEAASAAVSKLPPDLTRSLTEDLVDIRTSADRASLLTRQLMTVSRQETTQPRSLDLSVALGNLEAFLRRLVPAPIALTLDRDAETPKVLIDPIQLERIVINLVTNARDAMPTGGALTVSLARELLDDHYLSDHPEARRGSHAVLTVVDHGIGMDRETCARIFEPFFTTKESKFGTGLGLSTVYGIVQQAAGHIRVESTVGKGSTFFVYLPAAKEQGSEAGKAPRRSQADADRATILYCENEEDMQTQVVQLLGNGGYRVVCTRDAAETLERLQGPKALAPRLLLTDMVTTGMSGTELASAARGLCPSLPVAFFSGTVVDQERRDGAQGFWFVNKRYWRSALLAAVDEAIRKSERLPPGV